MRFAMNKEDTGDTLDGIVLLSHGGGGLLTKQLVEKVILSRIGNPILEQMDDGACISVPETELVFTTDSYVVTPPFFPGGDIGKLAVCGTVNDLAMQGAEPRFLSCGLILEQGFAIADLQRVVDSMAEAARRANVMIVAGDTKVIGRDAGFAASPAHDGRPDGATAGNIFINTAGIGARMPGVDVHVSNARPGDTVIITGPMGNHGMAVMCCREKGFCLETGIASDVAPLWELVKPMLHSVPGIRCMRDPTRGGVAAALCDIADRSGVAIRISEAELPVDKEVRGVCRLLGMDPLNAANEGIALVLCARSDAEAALGALRSHPLGHKAVVIGEAYDAPAGTVILETELGGERIVETPMGEDFPRIC